MASELAAAMTRYLDAQVDAEGIFTTPIVGLALFRASQPALPSHTQYRRALCIVVQGAKQVSLGDKVLDYGELQCLIISFDMPVLGRVTRASAAVPYLAMVLDLDVQVMREVMEQLDNPPQPDDGVGPGIFVEDMVPPLTDCMIRLLRLLETPKAIPVLYPAIMREVHFWLLTGTHARELCKLALPDSHTRRIADAIHLLRDNFARPIRVEELAAAARMSPSSFHQHFKASTTMTPLQYQKQLRLLEARRLMLANGANVSSAAYEVGYESASQFSREYSRMFGAAPKRDTLELKGSAA